MFKWLRNKLRVWLGVEYLQEDVKSNLRTIKLHDANFTTLSSYTIRHDSEINQLNKELDFFKSMCQVGTDVHMRTDSWAVVCLDGKPEYVNFVRLDSRDARHVMQFLKSFDKAQRITDAPYGMIDSFKW